jgi:hypothetical protein
MLPWRLEHACDLLNRPTPDQMHKAKDRSDALLHELNQLIEELLHSPGLRRRSVARLTVAKKVSRF